jgi:hypothetical protein
MVPISREKQVAGVVGALVLGYSLSWLATPGPGTGPVDSFSPNFGVSAAPVIVAPVTPRDERSVDASEPLNGGPIPLQARRNEPI